MGSHKRYMFEQMDRAVRLRCNYCCNLESYDQMIEDGGIKEDWGTLITEKRAYEILKTPSWIKVACMHCHHVFTKDD